MPWSASGLREELCMNHPNGPHSERNDPSLSTVCCFSLKCTTCPGAATRPAAFLPPSCLVASAQRGPLRDGLCSVTFSRGGVGWEGGWVDAWSHLVLCRPSAPRHCCFALHTIPVSPWELPLPGACPHTRKPHCSPGFSFGGECWYMGHAYQKQGNAQKIGKNQLYC